MQQTEKLEERRDNASDVTVIKGTQSHYHYKFEGVGKVGIRWLSCPCAGCLNKRWDQCYNTEWIGQFETVQMHQLDKRGVGQHNAKRTKLSIQIADKLQVGDIVALLTKVDPKQNRYWLVRVVKPNNCSKMAPELDED